jgi:flagellar protein FliJ
MNAHEYSVRLKPTAIEQKHRKLSRIELMIQELSSEVATLNRAIAAEEKKSGISDPRHYAYPIYAVAASQRRDNLLRTIGDLKRCATLEKLAA